MITNYILVDFENVQPKNLGRLQDGSFQLKVFVGAQQSKGRVPFELAETMHALGTRAEFVRIEGSGRNALDFHIAYYLGRLTLQHPAAHFHLISRDTDYDVLVRHLNAKNIHCRRWRTVDDIPALASPARDELAAIVTHLRNLKTSRPRKLRTLVSTLKARFGKGRSDADIQALVDELKRREVLKVAGTDVTYDLDRT